MKSNEKPIGLVALSQELRLPAKWLKGQAEAGNIPSLLVGKKRLFNPDAVRAALSKLAAQPPAAKKKSITLLTGITE
jgi:hypothetical protein